MTALSKIKGFNLFLIVFMIVSITVIKTQPRVELDQNIPRVILKDDLGGNINGEAWNSSKLKDKIHLILYVTPSQQDVIEPLFKKIDGLNYSKQLIETTLIINTSATWIPNTIIEGKVNSKAKEDTTKTYVLDNEEVLLDQWSLSEDFSNIILVDEMGKVSFIYKDKLNEKIENELLFKIKLLISKGELK